jgi:flagellin-like protein
MDLKDRAISPVIGVMLMLVVTIIIAAVVSGFAGSLTGASDAARTAALQGDFKQSGFMTISNVGGDILTTRNTRLVLRLSNDFGDVDYMSWDINKTILTNSSTASLGSPSAWVRYDGYTGVSSLAPGESSYVPNSGYQYLQPATAGSISSVYRINNTANVGKSFFIEAYDTTGKMIAKTSVKINP